MKFCLWKFNLKQQICQGEVFFLCRKYCGLIKISTQVTFLIDYFRYLEVEWEVKRKTHREFSKTSMVDLCPKVPKQDNSSDCGVYLLQYVESFFQVCADIDFPSNPQLQCTVTNSDQEEAGKCD